MTGRRPHPPRRPPLPALWATAVALLALVVAAVPARAGHVDGDKVEVTGVVTAPDGRPLDDVQVVLTAVRTQFDFRKLQRVEKDSTKLTAVTDEHGQYRLEWIWNGYYNAYELTVGVPVRKGDTDEFHVMERVDLTRRIKKGSPVVVPVTVANAEFITQLRAFLAGVKSDDERRVYREMGKPDKVEQSVYEDGGGRRDAAWWYFERGKVYRFHEGVLTEVESFDPVKDFP